jgi:HSP20 family molecular chaperone IbpA
VREKDIHLSMTGDVLSLRGSAGSPPRFPRRTTTGSSDGPARSSVTSSSRFRSRRRRFRASYRDGVLEIRLPKLEEVQPREIKIEVG